MSRVRIGNGCGFWGDNVDAPVRLARDGRLDYLTLEYLAELTMSILAMLKNRDENAGYATDFTDVLPRLAPVLRDQPSLKIVTNAGGMNPQACAKKAHKILKDAGVPRRIGIVHGDDILPRIQELYDAGHELKNLDTGEPLTALIGKIVSANVYLGSAPIVEALKLGAEIVITGRVADAALTVAPAAHAHGWDLADVPRIASATAAGHLIECGAQATGGLWMNADDSTNLGHVGYPIADIAADGSFTISKPANTGGAINLETLAEQLLYEVNDPARYLTPDVVADFTSLAMQQVAKDVVEVRNCSGLSATDSYKVSISYRDGWASSGTLVIAGPDSLPGVLPVVDAPEVVLRVAVKDANKEHVERFTKEFAPLVTGGLPGVTGYTTGRPAVRQVFAYWPALIAKSAVTPVVELLDPGS
jgi:hypothetical protein